MIEATKQAVSDWSEDAWDAIKGNGCTGIPDFWIESPCQRHDRHYETHRHRDGRPISRLGADWELAKDAWKALPVVPPEVWQLTWKNAIPLAVIVPARAVAKTVLPVVVFVGVRLAGWKFW